MSSIRVSRRDVFFGAAGCIAGGAATAAVGLTYRHRIKDMLKSYGTSQHIVELSDDGWLLTNEERQEFERVEAGRG